MSAMQAETRAVPPGTPPQLLSRTQDVRPGLAYAAAPRLDVAWPYP